MRDAVLVYFQLPPRMFKTFGAAPCRGAARVRPFPKFAHAREPFKRRRRVLRADREALRVAMLVFVKFDAAQFFFGFISVTVVSWLDKLESDAVTSHRHRLTGAASAKADLKINVS